MEIYKIGYIICYIKIIRVYFEYTVLFYYFCFENITVRLRIIIIITKNKEQVKQHRNSLIEQRNITDVELIN